MKKISSAILLIALLINLSGSSASAAASRKPAQTADALLGMLPDFDGVITINAAQINAQVEKLLAEKSPSAASARAHLNRVAARLGIDLGSIQQIAAGFSLAADLKRSQSVLLVQGAFDQQQILARLAAESGRAWKAKKHKGQKFYVQSSESGKAKRSKLRAAVSFFDDQSAVAFGTMESVKRVIAARAGSAATVLQNAALMNALQQTSATASVRFAFAVPEAARRYLAALAGPLALLRPLAAVTQVSGTAELTDEAALANVSLLAGSDNEAADVLRLINQGLLLARLALLAYPQLAAFAELLDHLSAAQAGRAVDINVNIPVDLLRRLLEQYGSRAIRK